MMEDDGLGMPPAHELLGRLGDVLASAGRAQVLAITDRMPNRYSSTFSSEVVSLRTTDGEITVFCKHGRGYTDPHSGHRRGITHEIIVYESVVAPYDAPAPTFIGSFSGPHGQSIVLEHLGSALRLHDTAAGDDGAVVQAASCLGAWHARGERIELADHLAVLNRFDERFFSRRLHDLASSSPNEVIPRPSGSGWIDESVDALAAATPTVVHGELFTSNVLVRPDNTVSFVDWETCGVGPGELDLAALTVGKWPLHVRDACEGAYVRARFGDAIPPWFAPALSTARLFVLLLLARHASSNGHPLDTGWFHHQLEAVAPRGPR